MDSLKGLIYSPKKFRFEDLSIYQENIALAGEHYSGKTYFAIEGIARPLLKAGVKVWVWDYHGLFAKSGYFQPHQICYYLDELQEGTQCYVPESKSEEHFEQFCGLAIEQYNLHVMVDEAHKFMSAQRIPPNFSTLIRETASNRGVSYTAIWQRISEGQKSVMSNARHKFLFNFDISDQDRYLRIFGKYADLFQEPESRKYFNDCSQCTFLPKHHGAKIKSHRFEANFPPLDEHSFIYKDDKNRESVVYNGGI